jgi:hypothetical protein
MTSESIQNEIEQILNLLDNLNGHLVLSGAVEAKDKAEGQLRKELPQAPTTERIETLSEEGTGFRKDTPMVNGLIDQIFDLTDEIDGKYKLAETQEAIDRLADWLIMECEQRSIEDMGGLGIA